LCCLSRSDTQYIFSLPDSCKPDTYYCHNGNKDINKGDRVYLGIAGREFRCRMLGDSNANPFHLKNHAATLTFGAGSNVEDAAINDPRDPLIDVAYVMNYPVYARTEANTGEWEIVNATVETSAYTSIFSVKYPGIIFDDDSGEKVELV
jgi:hypothetical protein